MNNDNKIYVENIYCIYCRTSIILQGTLENQICKKCNDIIYNNKEILHFYETLHRTEADALKLLEINNSITLKVLEPEILNEFSKKNKQGVIIEKNKIIGICLDNFDLTNFPDELYYFKDLKYLSLMNTKLRSIPESISRLNKLQALDIRKNNVEFLPDSITKISSLRVLNLHNNSLRLLPDKIGELSSLVYLNIENNLLYTLPDTFKSLENLRMLNLFDNQINLKTIVDKMPKNILKCGIGGNSISKKSFRLIKSIFKGSRKCKVYHTKTDQFNQNI